MPVPTNHFKRKRIERNLIQKDSADLFLRKKGPIQIGKGRESMESHRETLRGTKEVSQADVVFKYLNMVVCAIILPKFRSA